MSMMLIDVVFNFRMTMVGDCGLKLFVEVKMFGDIAVSRFFDGDAVFAILTPRRS